jgi:amidase
MARSVLDAAIILGVIAGSDPADPATAAADAHRTDYAAGLTADALKGVRIGVLRYAADFHPETARVFAAALRTLAAAGAILVDIDQFPNASRMGKLEHVVLMTELKADLDAYLSTTPPAVSTRTLGDLIIYNRRHAAEEMPLFGQESFEEAEATTGLDDPVYRAAERDAHAAAGPLGIDALLSANKVAALVAPTLGPAWLIDPVLKDRSLGGGAGQPAAIAGYPHLTVPMGAVDGLPVGLSFIGPAWSEGRILAYGYAFERLAAARTPPAYAPTAPIASEASWRGAAP